MSHPSYQPPWWCLGGHAQTIVPALAQFATPAWQEQTWPTPDGDFVDVVSLPGLVSAPQLVLFHGLEGGAQSHYAKRIAQSCQALGWGLVLPHFRGCGGRLNRLTRAYHSGDFAEIEFMLAHNALHSSHSVIFAAGVSLGGNALLRWGQELGSGHRVAALASVCAPVDLKACGQHMDRGLNRWLYTGDFLRSMKGKASAKWHQDPGSFSLERAMQARSLFEFDDAYTAPVHGYSGADDYWQRASAKPGMARIKLPTLLLNALNDPFVPASSLPHAQEVGSMVELDYQRWGGHVGFPSNVAAPVLAEQLVRQQPRHDYWVAQRLIEFFQKSLA